MKKLRAWDGNYVKTDAAGTVDPGVAIWEEFKDQLETLMIRRHGGEPARVLAGEPGTSHQFDISNGEALGLRTIGPKGYARAAKRTAKRLTERFGSPDPAAWREPRRLYDVGAQGAASAPELPFFDRGTWSQSLAMGRRLRRRSGASPRHLETELSRRSPQAARIAGCARCIDHPSFREGFQRQPGRPRSPRLVIGISFGVLAEPVMGPVAPIVMSAIVFAGSAQFGALAVLAAGGGAARGGGRPASCSTRATCRWASPSAPCPAGRAGP